MRFHNVNTGLNSFGGKRYQFRIGRAIACWACLSLISLVGERMAVAQQRTQVLAAGYSNLVAMKVAPGQIITFFAHGIGANITTGIRTSSVPLPTTLAGISAVFSQSIQIPVPIISIQPVNNCLGQVDADCSYLAITVQIPFLIDAQNPTAGQGVIVPGARLVFSDGTNTSTAILAPFVDQVHLLRGCDTILPQPASCNGLVTHADGTLVTVTNPAKRGEEIVMYAVGLGPAAGAIAGMPAMSPLPTSLKFNIGFDARPNATGSRPYDVEGDFLTTPLFTGLVSGFVGLYQINVLVPDLRVPLPCTPTGAPSVQQDRVDSNVTISVAGPASFDGIGICVAP